MRRLSIAALTLALAAPLPVAAQDRPEEPGLMERGVEMFLRGLMEEVGPEIGEMRDTLEQMKPELQRLVELMGDVQHYDMPERLPNGDILIRRKPGAPKPPDLPKVTPDKTPEGDAIDL